MKRAAFVLTCLAAIVAFAVPALAQSSNASPCAAGQPPGRPPGTPPGQSGDTPVGRPSQYPPRSECAMRLSSGVGAQGSSFTAAGEGFVPGSQVTVTMHSDPVVLGTTTANAAGAWSLKATVPSNAPLGSHTIVASDGVSSLSAPFEVRAAGNNAEKARSVAGVALPRTGTDTAALIALASLLIVIGLGAVTVARRRAIAA